MSLVSTLSMPTATPFMCFTATRVLRSPPCSPCLSSEAKGRSERCRSSTRNPLRTTITLPRRNLALLTEVAEYTAPLIQRMIDAGYKIEDRESAKFVARYTENRLVTDASEISVDENVITTVGEAIIRRTQILPYKRVGPDLRGRSDDKSAGLSLARKLPEHHGFPNR